MSQKYVAYKINWFEFERGWGSRPDGISLHKTKNDGKQYITKYWNEMPNEVPNEYSAPNGNEFTLIEVSKEISDLVNNKINLRYWQSDYCNLIKNGEINE